jgi:hypothetical protein
MLPTMRPVHGVRLALAGLFLVASCGGKSRDESRLLPPITADAGNTTNDDEPEIVRGCPGAMSLLPGIDACNDGSFHRTASPQCEVEEHRGALSPDQQALLDQFLAEDGNLRRVDCTSHDDCNQGPLGECWVDLAGVTVAGCTYHCRNDDDCGSDEACYCIDGVSACVYTFCRSDADCTPGHACWSPNAVNWICEHPDDECRNDSDCPQGRACNWCDGSSKCGRAGVPCVPTP